MNYNNYIQQTFSLDDRLVNDLTAVLYASDGSSYYVSAVNPNYNNGSPFYETLGYYANYFNRNYANNGNLDLIAIAYMDDRDLTTLFINNKVDFLLFETRNSNLVINIQCVDYKASNGNYYPIEDGDIMADYLQYDEHEASPYLYNNTSYGNYQLTLNQYYSKSVFDFSNLKGDNYRLNSLAIRGENIAFYDYGFCIDSHVDYLDFSYGSPTYQLENVAYQNGYNSGYQAGYVNGNNAGYTLGVNTQIDGNTATAFSYVTQAFNAVGGILELEVLPHVSLGLCFSIPLILVLIMTIFKLVRK